VFEGVDVPKEQDRVRNVTEALRALAAEDVSLGASSAVEARLMGEVRSIARARRRRAAMVALAAAAVLAAAIAVPWKRGASSPPADRQASTPAQRGEIATAFFPLTYSSLPISNAQLVRVQVPRSALASFGLSPIDVPASAAGGTAPATVSADVLVGEDGVARAVRFISP
jgi:hypothetical protein